MNERTIFLCDLTKCKLYLEKPITLPCCGHSICQKHVQNITSESKKYKCELCGKIIQVPSDAGFHVNLKLSYLIDLNRSQKKISANKQRSFSVGRPINNSNLSVFNKNNETSTTKTTKNNNFNQNYHQATKRKSSLSTSLPLSAQSTPPQSPSSPTPSGLIPKSIKSRIPLPIPPKRKQILSESGIVNKCDLNDSGLISTPAFRQQKENINNSSDQFMLPSSRRSFKNLLQSSPMFSSLSKITSDLNSVINKDEIVLLDAQTYKSLIQDLHDTKEILYKLEETLLQDANCSLNESGLNDSVVHEFNKSDFVFDI